MLSKRQSGFERIQRGILPPPNNLVLIPPNRGNLEGKGREWLTYINFFFFFWEILSILQNYQNNLET